MRQQIDSPAGNDMDGNKLLRIDLDELCTAMENRSCENEYYLDLVNGEILFLSEYMDDEETDKLRGRIDKEPDRYEQIPQIESDEGYEDMQDFIATVKNEHLADLLEVEINGKGAFRRFKDVLLNYPEERQRWFQFMEGRTQERALKWLDDINVSLIEE